MMVCYKNKESENGDQLKYDLKTETELVQLVKE